ncbi:secreted aspartic proteinase precursor [Diaporthe amygdali]|uniref:secreted aspartic proteinase precursor n=1 Tax=Phomopsis amygdali TaxID=1214568 RepID=UPI0022FE7F1D|nr:secreted aspartic proteinase precursor [Diaporthe amygdali]KAJ0124812.1 secreted aspartic proteinase precursor [Diaporthe amygdali]
MGVSATKNMQFICMCLALLVSTSLCIVPSVGTFTMNTIPNPGFKGRNGTAAYLKALAKYAHLADNDGVNKATSPFGEVVGFSESNDREWLCPIKIGTPGQTLNLDLDTGSADLWVFTPESVSHPGELGNRSIFDVNVSSTARHQDGRTWTITYGDGSFAEGSVITDHVELGNLTIKNATIEVATHFSRNLIDYDPFLSGLMGLAINLSTTVSPEEAGVTDGILSQLKRKGIGSIAVDLQYHNEGTFSFGKVNTSAYNGEMHYQPVMPGEGYWQIQMSTLRYAESNETMVHAWPSIIDTGTSLMLMGSDDVVQDYWKLVPSAKYSYSEYGFIFRCNETLPDFHFGFVEDWTEFTVPGAYMNYSPTMDSGDGWCYGGLQSSNMGVTVIGDVILKALYVDFNIAKESVGFASKPLRT